MAWYKVADEQDTPVPVRAVKAGGKELCLIYNGNEYFVTQLKCPHAGADLSTGWCSEGQIVCPYHRYRYDLHTGKGATGQGDYISTYLVKVEHGKIMVQVNTFADKIRSLFGKNNSED